MVEPVDDRINLLFLSLLEYRRETYLCIIDNITPSEVRAYVLDYAEQEKIPIVDFLSIVTRWFYSNSENYPLSVELAKYGLTDVMAPIFRSFATSYVSRIVGKEFKYDQQEKNKVKRRRVVPVSEGMEIRFKRPEAHVQ